MLRGYIIYKDEKYGDLRYNVFARDSFNDLKMQLSIAAAGEEYSKYIYQCQLFDLLDDGTFNKEYESLSERDKQIRRLDVKKTNKYKSNITNKEFAIKLSALIRYMQIAGKKQYNQQATAEFSATRDVEIIEIKTRQKIGDISYNMGLITKLHCCNKYFEVHLDTAPDDDFGESIFKELKEKDKFGNKLSGTPISIVGFKLSEELLGFPYVPEIVKETPQVFGMYETIEEVIANNPDKNTAWILDQEYHIVTDDNLEEVMKMFNEHDGLIAYDTETSGLNINFKSRTNEADQLVGVVLSRKPGEGYYFPLQHKLFANLCGGDHFYFMDKYMRPLLENKQIICHNLKFDWKVAHIYDINVNCVYDTMLALGVTKRYEEETYELGLKALTKNIFGRDSFELSDFVMGGSFGDSEIAFWDLPYELVRQYAPADTDNTYALYEFIEKEDILNKYDAKKVFEMEITFAKAVAYSEFYGYHIDVEKIPELQEKIVGEMNRCQQEMFKIAGEEFNPNSPAQLVKIMYDKLGVETIGEKQSTDKETLKTLASRTNPDGSPKYPFVKMLKTYRDNEGIYKNFLKKLPEFATTDGYIFPDVLQIGTNTGRVSVKNPNYQSYNDIVKHYVVPRPDFMHFDSDFAQIEQRVLVSYASIMFNDFESLALLQDFDDPDMDYHQYQAARMFNVPYAAVTKSMRQQSKGINFGLPYGMGDSSLGARIFGERNAENTKKAADLRKKFFQGQELIEDFFEKVRSEGVSDGFTRTQWGRRRYYHKGVFSVNEIRRQAGNHVIQGCSLGTTKIQTKELGIVQLQDVAGFNLSVWNGHKWTRGDILPSGKKQKCIVTFRGGQQFICSPEHLFLVVSHKGNKRWVACKDLLAKENVKHAHRVVINRNYEPSNNMYNSKSAYKYAAKVHNANNVFLEHIGNSYDIGLFLGRVASDGSIYAKGSIGRVTQLVAEHEYNILPELRECMRYLNFREISGELRKNRTERMTRLEVGSKSLANEIKDLDVKHQIHKNIFMDTEVLRGFLCGMFDGDGGVCGKGNNKFINLVFGKQYDFEPMCRDIQKALLFLGIRSYFNVYPDRYTISIRRLDVPRFLDMVGFMNDEKMKKGRSINCNKDEHIFGPSLMVESVEITDEYVDMYDVCNTEDGYYVADGLITHNTAADIYKKSVNNMFERICKEGWLGKVLINGFIHDEMLMEVHKSINPYYFFKAWREEFEVRPANYCKLYAGAGVGKCWYDAKKLDLHPLYIQEIIDMYNEDMDWDEDIDKFLTDAKQGFKDHKLKRVKDYMVDETVQGEVIKPAISALLGDEIETILGDITSNEEKISEFSSVLEENKLDSSTKKIKGLQDQLRLFCKYYDIDYSKVDIKAPEDVDITSTSAGSNGVGGYEEEDEIVVEVDKEELLNLGLITNGIIIDHETRTIHMAELFIKSDKGYIQGTKKFIEEYMIVKGDKGYKIMYYPNLKGEKPNGAEIKGYCVPFENGTVLMHYYKEMLSHKFAQLVR